MLLPRILTAIPLIALAIWFVLTANSHEMMWTLIVIVALGAYEWAGLSAMSNHVMRAGYAVLTAYLAWLALQYADTCILQWLAMGSAAWFVVLLYLWRVMPQTSAPRFRLWKPLAGIALLTSAAVALAYIQREHGGHWLLFSLSLVWVADIGAYFSGKNFGKTKLSLKLSPGKTREGLYGATILTLLYGVGAGFYFQLDTSHILYLALAMLIIAPMSVVGDLLESLLKREQGVKDSGRLLPGHGGILDRIDSVLAAAPMMALWLILFVDKV